MLAQLREHQNQIEAVGAQVIGVGTREDYQAQNLLDEGMPFPLLLDAENSVRAALGVSERISPLTLLNPKGAVAYARALRQARRFGPIWAEATQRPAVVVFDSKGSVVWSHLGTRLGDYPSVGECLGALSEA